MAPFTAAFFFPFTICRRRHTRCFNGHENATGEEARSQVIFAWTAPKMKRNCLKKKNCCFCFTHLRTSWNSNLCRKHTSSACSDLAAARTTPAATETAWPSQWTHSSKYAERDQNTHRVKWTELAQKKKKRAARSHTAWVGTSVFDGPGADESHSVCGEGKLSLGVGILH